METETVIVENKLTKKDLHKSFWRLQIFGLGLTVNNMSAQAIGFATAISPVLEKIYDGKPQEEKVAAMERHLTYFLSQNTATGMILGITAALEETTNEDEKEAVIATKSGMMGPLAGIGDSVFKITIQAIAGSIGAAYALQGNILGPILMFVIYNGINIFIKYKGVMLGYEKGLDFITSGDQAKAIEKIINIATAVGVIVLGALIGSFVKIQIGTELVVGETKVVIQELLDNVMPNLLPLLFTVFLYKLHDKIPRKHLITMIFTILVLGTALAAVGILV
ncbi:PTS system mannose/fructose/sorbose family transporter subunit IID [Erysipelothrix urinaevulpis]|uniref:PTS system mannose/fructose/sorbose family transporter subunit IID n=1 Tax=Erysipelothrix urinaevulpis TaxID=2683717 RepID=UPI0013593EA8|nr:PTS system mannose/fructose/sorbose family transporter subunit IID [Erysipelothrix urinaevulpis]